MRHYFVIFILGFTFTACQSQSDSNKDNKLVGGPCEGCEAIFEYGNKTLTPIDTLPGFKENEPKLRITGTIFEKDGKTPAKDVIIYIYHTNKKGIYETKGNEKNWAKRHGFIRGWIKTNNEGKYTFYTFRPASYPNTKIQQHIHITVKEPTRNEYYIDNYEFEDDPFLTEAERNKKGKRGGSGIVLPKLNGDIYHIERDIILGLNIPGYH